MVEGRGAWPAELRSDATREHTGCVVEVAADGGTTGRHVHLEDRVGAVGGRLQVDRTAGGVTRAGRAAVRVAVADDEVLLREGLSRLLERGRHGGRGDRG